MVITGEADRAYCVQTKTNLADWITEATVTNTTGTVLYSTDVPPGTS